LSNSNIEPYKVPPPTTAEMVRGFYVSDQISRNTPGTNGYLTEKARRFIFRNDRYCVV
jgi:hypothetical protein